MPVCNDHATLKLTKKTTSKPLGGGDSARSAEIAANLAAQAL
jgi:hypothetical protein